jgi:hypothetical protein
MHWMESSFWSAMGRNDSKNGQRWLSLRAIADL